MTEKVGINKLLLILYSAYCNGERFIVFFSEAYKTQSHSSEVTILCMKIEGLFKNIDKKGVLQLFSGVDRKIEPTLPITREIRDLFKGSRRYIRSTETVLYEAIVPERIYRELLGALEFRNT